MKEVRNITCRQAHRLLHKQLDGVLASAVEERLRRHWAACAACAEHARRVQTAVEVLRSAAAPEPSAALAGRIRAAAGRAWREAPAPAARLRLAPAWAAAAAVVAVVLALVFVPRALAPTAPVTPAAPPVAPAVAASPAAPGPELPVEARVAPAPSAPVVMAAAPAASALPSRPSRNSTRVDRSGEPSLAPAAATAPSPRLAYVHARTAMADMTAASPDAPMANTVEGARRVTPVNLASTPNPGSRNSGDFASEVVGGLVADAVLSDYLEGAPAGLKVTPALLTTGGGG